MRLTAGSREQRWLTGSEQSWDERDGSRAIPLSSLRSGEGYSHKERACEGSWDEAVHVWWDHPGRSPSAQAIRWGEQLAGYYEGFTYI